MEGSPYNVCPRQALKKIIQEKHVCPDLISAQIDRKDANILLKRIKERVSIAVPNIIQQNINKLHVFEDQIRVLDPKRLLARGWSITRTQNGEIISSTNNLFNGDEIVTIFEDGTVKSTINEVVI